MFSSKLNNLKRTVLKNKIINLTANCLLILIAFTLANLDLEFKFLKWARFRSGSGSVETISNVDMWMLIYSRIGDIVYVGYIKKNDQLHLNIKRTIKNT